MGKRRLARETALQALYLSDISALSAAEAYLNVGQDIIETDEKSSNFAKALVDGADAHRKELDEKIQATADNWELKRMAAVDRAILRLAAYELLHEPDTPVNVIIDEAIEIAKKYSSEHSSKFINGLLDKLKESRQR